MNNGKGKRGGKVGSLHKGKKTWFLDQQLRCEPYPATADGKTFMIHHKIGSDFPIDRLKFLDDTGVNKDLEKAPRGFMKMHPNNPQKAGEEFQKYRSTKINITPNLKSFGSFLAKYYKTQDEKLKVGYGSYEIPGTSKEYPWIITAILYKNHLLVGRISDNDRVADYKGKIAGAIENSGSVKEIQDIKNSGNLIGGGDINSQDENHQDED